MLKFQPRARYGITRIDQPHKKNHGFWVRITHKGKMYQKFFPDKTHGGMRSALRRAKAFRDCVLSLLPEEKQRKAAQPRVHLPQSGVVGVTYVIQRMETKRYHYWQAAWFSGYRSHIVKYSVRRYGFDLAKRLALASIWAKRRLTESDPFFKQIFEDA